eukprot:3367691-Rhodomonas_salina.1
MPQFTPRPIVPRICTAWYNLQGVMRSTIRRETACAVPEAVLPEPCARTSKPNAAQKHLAMSNVLKWTQRVRTPQSKTRKRFPVYASLQAFKDAERYLRGTLGSIMMMTPGFRAQGSGLRVQGSGLRVQGSGFR